MATRRVFRPAWVAVVMLAAVPGPGPAAAHPAQPESRARQSVAPAILIPPPGVTQELALKDGTRAYGRVERIDGSSVVFRTATGGTLEIDAAQIVSLKPVEGRVIKGSFLAADPNPTRLFFGPTARSLPRGGGYVAVYEVVVSGAQVGITDRISLGAGTPLVFGGGSEHPVWITPKVQVLNARTTQGAIGIMHFLNVGGGNLGVAYGVVTHGTRDSAVTLGAGYAYDHTSSRVDGAAVGMVGAEHRVSRRMKLVTENYAFQGGGIGSFGVRFFGDRLSADLALVVPLGMGESVAFPMVNFVYRFGR